MVRAALEKWKYLIAVVRNGFAFLYFPNDDIIIACLNNRYFSTFFLNKIKWNIYLAIITYFLFRWNLNENSPQFLVFFLNSLFMHLFAFILAVLHRHFLYNLAINIV